MKKRIQLLVSLLLTCLLLAGCWDYNSLNDLDIVTGFAVDKDWESGNYLLTMEIVDIKSGSEQTSTLYIEAEGDTLFSAIRNSKKRLINKLYGGNLQTVIISHQIAEIEGVDVILEQLLRDGEPRETLSIVISQEKTAREIMLTDGLDSRIIAYEINEIVTEDNRITSATKYMPLYKAYEAIHGVGNALVLPAIRCVKNNDKTVAESNGIALFKGDKLIGYNSPQDTMLYLIMVNESNGGALSLPYKSAENLISLEILKEKTRVDAVILADTLQVLVDIKINVNIQELKSQVGITQLQERNELEEAIARALEERIAAYFDHIQKDVGVDIFGFGNKIYQKNPELWRSIEGDWDTWFQNASLDVKAQAKIQKAGVLKNY